MNNTISVRHSQVFHQFVTKMKGNRVKAGTDEISQSTPKVTDTIVKYFKENNDRYLELLSMEVEHV